MKYIKLIVTRYVHCFFRKLPIVLSYFFLVFSSITCLTILMPRLFYRAPILSYCVSELNLPFTYELSGEVKILDKDGKLVNKNVEVFVGGYSTSLETTKLRLKFSSPLTKIIFVVIRYEVNGKTYEKTQSLMIDKDCYSVREDFIIHV